MKINRYAAEIFFAWILFIASAANAADGLRESHRAARTFAADESLLHPQAPSLSYLRRFAVDAIKIDKSFVDDIGADANAEAVCDAILRLGKSLNTKIVAEGVENSLQLEFLRARRCDEVQGYFFSKPLPLAAFEKDWVAVRAVA